jgi:hypothetical protein
MSGECTCGFGDRAAIAQRPAEREAIEAALKKVEAERDQYRTGKENAEKLARQSYNALATLTRQVAQGATNSIAADCLTRAIKAEELAEGYRLTSEAWRSQHVASEVELAAVRKDREAERATSERAIHARDVAQADATRLTVEVDDLRGNLLRAQSGLSSRSKTKEDEKKIADLTAEVERLKPNQREHDLVRHQRMELHAEHLITDAEYAALASEHGGVQRLEDYDRMREEVERLKAQEAVWEHAALATVKSATADLDEEIRLEREEIERLKQSYAALELARLHDSAEHITAVEQRDRAQRERSELRAEVERLRADLVRARSGGWNHERAEAWTKRAEAAEAEVERLRAEVNAEVRVNAEFPRAEDSARIAELEGAVCQECGCNRECRAKAGISEHHYRCNSVITGQGACDCAALAGKGGGTP